jgi:hypothetical protein
MFRGLLGVALALMLTACGGGTALNAQQEFNLLRSSFELNVWDESLLGASADSFSPWVDYPDNDWVTVDISVTGAHNLKALYFDLQYDEAMLEPVGVDFYDTIAPEDQRLEQIELGHAQGSVFASEVIRGLTAAGFSGSGRLARVLFKRK